MENQPLISVIVPIYKVEEYLNRCVESIVNQTYHNLEIILVDDGSPDNCPELCDDWAKKDERIKVIHKENGGLSDARNAGLEVAQGEYISFIDSDDWINIHFFEILLKTLTAENSDIAQCERIDTSVFDDRYLNDDLNYNVESFDNERTLSMLINEDKFKQVVWNKLYKRDLANHLFVKGVLNEDEFWTYKTVGAAKKCTCIDVPLYFYFKREGSIMGSTYSIRRLDGVRALVERHDYIKSNFPKLITQSALSVYGTCMYHYQMAYKYLKDEKKNAYCYLKSVASDFVPDKLMISSLPSKQRMWLNMSKVSFSLTCKLRALLGVGF